MEHGAKYAKVLRLVLVHTIGILTQIEQTLRRVQIKLPPFKSCIQTSFMLHHTNLWLISGDKSSLRLVDIHFLKGDNTKLTSAF